MVTWLILRNGFASTTWILLLKNSSPTAGQLTNHQKVNLVHFGFSLVVLNRCFPSEAVNATADYALQELNARELGSQVIADFAKSWRWICVCLTVAVVLGFIWLLLMRLFAGVIVWLTIIVAYGALIGITIFLWFEGTCLCYFFVTICSEGCKERMG